MSSSRISRPAQLRLIANEEGFVVALGDGGPGSGVKHHGLVAALLPFPNAKTGGHEVREFAGQGIAFPSSNTRAFSNSSARRKTKAFSWPADLG